MADHSQMQRISARSGTLFDVAALKVLWMGSLQAAFRGAAPKFWEADSAVEWPSRQPPSQLWAFWRAAELCISSLICGMHAHATNCGQRLRRQV